MQYPTETVVAATTEAFLSDAKLFWRTPFASKHERAAAQVRTIRLAAWL